ncbi:MAG: heme exporter protein CcmD [Pseudomonadota bacterium]|nr:heme exporter protein CcmD [Pseudomonadota bacterium]
MPDIQFDSLGDFLNMGGYAFYVWTAYLITFVVLAANLLLPLRDRKRVLKLLKARMQREAAQSGQSGLTGFAGRAEE